MRLINTTTQTLDEFESAETPPYAILSHTWTNEEIDYQNLLGERESGKEAGYAELEYGCKVAAAAGYDYLWLDTCWLRDMSTNGGRYIRVERQTLKRVPLNTVLMEAGYASISATKGGDEDVRKLALHNAPHRGNEVDRLRPKHVIWLVEEIGST
jgi:hypothetical protein